MGSVLARVNSLLLAPHVALAEAGVPLTSVLSPDVLERTGMRAALAYLRIATAGDAIDPHDVVEVLRRPTRGLPQWFPDRLARRTRWSTDAVAEIADQVPDKESAKVLRLAGDAERTRNRIDAAVAANAEHLAMLRTLEQTHDAQTQAGPDLPPALPSADELAAVQAAARRGTTRAVLEAVRDGVGLGSAMTMLDRTGSGQGSSHLDDLEGLLAVADLHPDPAGFESWLRGVFTRAASPHSSIGGASGAVRPRCSTRSP